MQQSDSSKTSTSGRDPAQRRKYANDPWGYFHDILGIQQLTPDQHRLLEAVLDSDRVLAKASNSTGKCVSATSTVTLASGERVLAKDLVGRDFQLLTLDEQGCVVVADARAEWNKHEPVYRVTTESGRQVTANAEHPLYAGVYVGRYGNPSADPVLHPGWRGINTLSEGDPIAVPTILPAYGDQEQDASFIKVIAYLLAEGSFNTSTVVFSQNPGPQMDEFTACLDEMGNEYRVAQPENRAPFVSVKWTTPLGQQVEALGLRGANSHTVRFPDFVWSLPRHQLALFVNRLWAGDGCWFLRKPTAKSPNGVGTAEYTSVSEQMARDVQHALLRLGVSAKLHKRKTGYIKPDGSKWRGEAWTLLIMDVENLVKLGEALGPVVGKEQEQADCMDAAQAVLDRREARRKQARLRVGNPAYKPWRTVHLPSTLRWEKVASIERLPGEWTVGIEVPEYHTYLDDIYQHNTHLLAAIGVWWMDAVAAQLDEEGREQGALWIMTAPDASTVDSTIWARALEHIGRAKRLGFDMPGEYSEKSVLWRVPGEDWNVEKLSPPKRVGQEQQHGAAGRHHRNLLITIDEGPGVDSARYRAAEGMASGTGNKIVVAGNPTEVVGPYAQRAEGADYKTIRISSLDHPNVIERREIIPGGAIGHKVIDARVKDQCFDRGEYEPGRNEPDPAFFDFLYRLHPWVGDDERKHQIPDPCPASEPDIVIGNETYRVLGHADGPLHVYRPDGRFLSSTMGHFPLEGSGGLFPSAYIDRAFEAWLRMNADGTIKELERRGYDRVGLDPAEEGGDSPMGAPLWFLGETRVFDRIKDMRRGLDHEVAARAFNLFGKKPEYVVDAIGVGSGVATRLAYDMGCRVERFKASEKAWHDEDAGEPEFYNKRAAAYWRASILLKEGKVAMPPDSELKEELMSHSIENRNGSILVTPKKKIRQDILGRSPDKSDAFVQALWDEREQEEGGAMYAPTGGRSPNERKPPVSYAHYYGNKEVA